MPRKAKWKGQEKETQLTIERELLNLPDPELPEETQCFKVTIPAGAGYEFVLRYMLDIPAHWFNWKRTGDNRGSLIAQLWRRTATAIETCDECEEGDCIEYRPDAAIIEWQPNDPFRSSPIPVGYDRMPLYTPEQSYLPGLQPKTVICDLFSSLPDSVFSIPDLILNSGFPRFRLSVPSSGTVELHFLPVPQGGYAFITFDGGFTTFDVVNLASIEASDLISVSTVIQLLGNFATQNFYPTRIYEKKFDVNTPHYIDVTFIPNAVLPGGSILPEPFWGGGLVKVVLCGFDGLPSNVTVDKGEIGVIGETNWLNCDECPPETHLLEDGATYNRVDYPELYAAIAEFYKIDANTFRVPDKLNRMPIGAGDEYEVGDEGGEARVTLDDSELPDHTHARGDYNEYFLTTLTGATGNLPGLNNSNTAGWTLFAANNSAAFKFGTRGNTGGIFEEAGSSTQSHNNMPPYQATLPCIRHSQLTLEGAPGVPGAPGAPGNCDCEETTEPETPPPVNPETYPPEVDSKCAAAETAVQWVYQNLCTRLADLAGAAPTIFLIALAVAAAFGLLSLPLTAVAIIAAAPLILELIFGFISATTEAIVLSEYGAEFQEKLRCYIYCELGDDLQMSQEGFERFEDQIDQENEPKWAIIKLLNSVGGRGIWNTIMQTNVLTENIPPCNCFECLPDLVRDETGRKDGIVYLGNNRWKVISVDGGAPSISDAKISGRLSDGSCFYMRNIVTTGVFPGVSGWVHRRCDNSTFNQRHPGENECMKQFAYTRIPFSLYSIEFDLIKVDGVCD